MKHEIDEGLALYLGTIGRYPRLTEEQEKQADRETLITSNLRLVVHIAKQYAPVHEVDRFVEYLQDGNEGLVKAADAYDPSRGKFSVCAALYIRGEIRNRRADGLGCRIRQRKVEDAPPVLSYDDAVSIDEPGHHDPSEEAHRYTALRAAERVCSPKQWEVVAARLDGREYAEIAAERGVTRQGVQQLEKAALKIIAGGACVTGNSTP